MSASESRSAVVMGLAEEFLERYRQGQRPSLKEYIDRHPELAAEIKDVFPAMALMENIALDDESLIGAATGPHTVSGTAPPEQLGDYRILREVGRGGMGIVYEAEQVSLGRHVALKVLPRKVLLDAAQKRRFEREARAAAKLHHTNIVPVFGVGEHDGLPYYVMQFIQGLGLDDVLDELKRMQGSGTPTATGGELRVSRGDVSAADVARSLLTGAFQDGEPAALAAGLGTPHPAANAAGSPESSGKLSDSFTLSASSVKLPTSRGKGKKATYWQSVAHIGVQVAEALEYAHKQGIQHRDIKPSNLLLDTAGTVWVTDFGLARADNEDHLTATGDIVGTLRYMPPEAFEGKADKRGDIYSLGLTLYEMLARQPAFAERDRHRLIKRVTTEEPSRLDKLNRTIPRDLVTIIHKAIDREPARRYQTAGELATDLQRFLDDEPIRARRISQRERLLRWFRHHPGVAMLTAALAVIFLGVTVASIVAAARFERAATDERVARQAADDAKQQADQQKQRAEANFAKAQKAVDEYFTTVSESQLLQVSGMQPLRRDLLQSALSFYQDFLKERGDDPALRGELAAAFLRVAKIHSELGEKREADKAYEQARQLYAALTKAAPGSVEWRHGLAQSCYGLDRIGEAVALWENLVQSDEPVFRKELADAYGTQGDNHARAGRLGEAQQAYQRAQALREKLVRSNPDDPIAQHSLNQTLYNLGRLLAENQRLAEALAMLRRAAEHGEIAFQRAPQVIRNGRWLAFTHNLIALLENRLGRFQEAAAASGRATEVWRKLARDNPAIPSLHVSLFKTYQEMARFQRALKQIEQAERTRHLAREMLAQLPSESANDLFTLACVRAECSTFLGQGMETPSVENQAEQKHEADLAMEALRKAVAAGFGDVNRLRSATELNALHRRDDFKALQADLAARAAAAPPAKLIAGQQALSLRQKLAQADPANRRLQADLAASRHAMALILLDLGKPNEAGKQLQEAVDLRQALLKEEPANAQYQSALVASRFALGDLYWQSGRLTEAVNLWQRELEKVEASLGTEAGRALATAQLLTLRRTMAEKYARSGLWREAAAQFDRLISLEGTTDHDCYHAACLAVRIGDGAAYRRACEAMDKRFGGVDYFFDCYVAWAHGLQDPAGAELSSPIARFLSRARQQPTANVWRSHVIGLSHYRAGRFAEAIAAAHLSAANTDYPPHFLNYALLALAHHRLGRAAQAREWLDKARAEWRRLSPLPGDVASLTVLPALGKVYWNSYWHDWVTFEILLGEASRTVAGSAPAEEAYDRVHRSLLYSRLGKPAQAEAEWKAAVESLPDEPRIWLARARQLIALKRRKEAENALAKVGQLPPNDAEMYKERGRLYFEMGQRDKAVADFKKVVQLLGVNAEPAEPATSEADKLLAQLADEAYLQRLTSAVEAKPEDMAKRRQRGEWYAEHRRWKEAAADFRMVLEHKPPNDPLPWLHAAPVLVAAGDHESYRRLCRDMLERFDKTQEPLTADKIAKACLLLPEAVPDTERAGRLADRAVQLGKNNQWAHYFAFCKGLADYRRGNFRSTVEGLDPLASRTALEPELAACCHPVLAMGLHRQGESKAAHEHLAKAAKLLEPHALRPTRFPQNPNSRLGYNTDWLIAWLLHREAQTLIEGKKAESKK